MAQRTVQAERLIPVLQIGVGIAALGLAAVAYFFGESILLLGAGVYVSREVLFAVAAAIGLLAVVLRWLGPQAALCALVFSYSLILVELAGYRPVKSFGAVTTTLGGLKRIHTSNDDWFDDRWTVDERYGIRGVPNIAARQHHRDFDVVYHIGADGFRIIPKTSDDPLAKEIDFVGCSFTFGSGVEDDETFSAILAAEAWPRRRVRNISCGGWSTTHSYLAIQDLLEHSERILAIFHGYIGDHLRRNHLRRSYRQVVRGNFPFFELVDGRAKYRGVRKFDEATIPDGKGVDREEEEITLALLRGMAEMCRAKAVPFAVLVLHRKSDRILDRLVAEGGVNVIDVSGASDDFHPIDGHPTRYWHRAVAAALAASPEVRAMIGEDPSDGSAVVRSVDPVGRWRLAVTDTKNNSAILQSEEGTLRVEDIRMPEPKMWDLRVFKDHLPIDAGRTYEFSFEARADVPRRIQAIVLLNEKPWTNLGLSTVLEVGGEWREHRLSFKAKGSTDNAQAGILLGDSTSPVELRGLSFRDEAGEVHPRSERAKAIAWSKLARLP